MNGVLSAGDVLADRYRVVRPLGEGGMAEVYLVEHLALQSRFAFKLLTWQNQSLRDRLYREGRIQARLKHPAIVNVLDVIEHEGLVGLLMEYVEGGDLEEVLEKRFKLPLAESLSLFEPILDAVGFAHQSGVTHRDIKPGNVLLTQSTRGWSPKVTDFGIAKVAVDPKLSTRHGVTMGTPGYLPPEQFHDSASVDHRADIFALGVLLYELLTGELPYMKEEAGHIATLSTLEAELIPLSSRAPEAIEYEAVIHQALERDPDRRFQTCAEFATALGFEVVQRRVPRPSTPREAASTLPLDLDEEPDDPAQTPEPTFLPEPTTEETSAPASRLPLLIGAAGVVVGAMGLFLAWTSMQPPSLPATSVAPTSAVQTFTSTPKPHLPGPVELVVSIPSDPPSPVETPGPTPLAKAAPPPTPSPKVEETPPTQPAVVPEPASAPEPTTEPVETVPEPSAPPLDTPPVSVEPILEDAQLLGEPIELTSKVEIPAEVQAATELPPTLVAEPESPVPLPPDATGKWRGKMGRSRVTATLTSTGSRVTGSLAVVQVTGRPPRTESLRGTIQVDGTLSWKAGDWDFSGKLTDDTMSGTYRDRGKPQRWSLRR